MKRFFFSLGLVLVIVAAATAVAQLFSFLAQGGYQPIALGSIWYNVHANSLVGFQARIEQSISPSAWPPIQWFLQLPAWLTLGVLGILLMLAGRGRDRRGFDY